MKIETKRFLRKIPFICKWEILTPLFTEEQLKSLEAEVSGMQTEYARLASACSDVLEETRQKNPQISSELRIRELVQFRASRLQDDINVRQITLDKARKYLE